MRNAQISSDMRSTSCWPHWAAATRNKPSLVNWSFEPRGPPQLPSNSILDPLVKLGLAVEQMVACHVGVEEPGVPLTDRRPSGGAPCGDSHAPIYRVATMKKDMTHVR